MRKLLTVFLTLSFPVSAFSLTMDEAVETALKNNFDIKTSVLKERIASENMKVKKRDRFGKFLLQGSYTHYNIPRTLIPIVPPITSPVTTTEDVSSLGFAYTVNIFSGFSKREDVKIAAIEKHLTEISKNLTKSEVAYNVRALFLKALSLNKSLQAAKSYLDSLKTLQKDVKVGVETGKRPELDLLKVNAEVAKVESQIEQIKSGINTLKNGLAFLMGVQSVENLEEVKEEPKIEVKETDVSSFLKAKIASLSVKKAEKSVKKIKSSFYPSIDFNAYYGWNFGDGDRENLWQFGVSLNWAVFDFGVRRGRLLQTKDALSMANIEKEKVKSALIKELKDVKEKIRSTTALIGSIKEEVKFTEKVESVEELKYKVGSGTIYDLLTAKAKYYDALSKLESAKYSYIEALYYLKYLKGEVK